MFLWKCNCFPLLLIDKSRNVQSFRNVTWTHKLAMYLTPDPYRKWTSVPWVRSAFHFGLVSAYKCYNLNSLGCQWLWQNNLNPSMDILPWTTSTPMLQTLWGCRMEVVISGLLVGRVPKWEVCTSKTFSPSVTWPSPPFHASVRSLRFVCLPGFWKLVRSLFDSCKLVSSANCIVSRLVLDS